MTLAMRILLTGDDFRILVEGGTVIKRAGKVKIIMSDIGFGNMANILGRSIEDRNTIAMRSKEDKDFLVNEHRRRI